MMKMMTTDKVPTSLGGIRTVVSTLILGLSALLTPLCAESSLSEKSPFLPPGHGVKPPEPVKPTVQPEGPITRELEFRGLVEIGGVYQFSIFNKKDQKGYWLKEDKASESGIVVRDYDEDSSSIIVNMNGRSERLTLMAATENPMPVAQATATTVNPATPNLPPGLNIQQQSNDNTNRRTIPRRRVVLPKKTN